MKRGLLIGIFLSLSLSIWANRDSLQTRKRPLLDRVYQVVKKFSQVDSNYIERQHYNYTVMMQSTITHESYELGAGKDQSIELSPDISVKLGPYIGWRWVVLGYTLDLTHASDGHRKHDIAASFYSNQLGVDLFWRTMGSGYRIKKIRMGQNIDTSPLHDVLFNGFSSSVKGVNLYYIFNHRHFSYPAAFSQSTVQRRSCGSLLTGLSFMEHNIHFDNNEMARLLGQYIGPVAVQIHDSILSPLKTHYTDISLSAGYAYNWVFAHNWLLAGSLSAAVGYKRSAGTSLRERLSLPELTLENLNLDVIGRFALVYNNTRWYAGTNFVVHSYRYKKSQFSTKNVMSHANIYIGMNLGKRR